MHTHLQRLFAPILYIVFFFAGFLAAFLWFAPHTYLNNLTAAITAVAALALVWLAYVFAKLSLQQRLRESARLETLQQENVRPVLHAVLRPAANAPHLIELALSNHGKGTAHSVCLHIESVASTPATDAIYARMQPLAAISYGLDMLAAGESYSGVFADFNVLAAQTASATLNGIIKISADCQDAFGNPCRSESIIDLSVLAAMQPTPTAHNPRKKLLY